MKPKKPKASEPSLRSKLFRALESDFEAHGVETIEKLRESDPKAYVEVAARVATVVEQSVGSYDDCQSVQDIARKLLALVGVTDPDEASIERAVEAHSRMIDGLKQIRADVERGLN
jgi:hypothetical protein